MLIAVGMLDTVDHNDGDDNFHYCKIANQCKIVTNRIIQLTDVFAINGIISGKQNLQAPENN